MRISPSLISERLRCGPQDYHSAPDTYLREQLMIHVFYYLNGLDGQIGDL